MSIRHIIFIPLILIAIGCEQSPQSIAYGEDDCHWCKMRIMDPKFGSEAITDKGRTYKFDSAECLLHYVNDTETDHRHLLVTDFETPEEFLNAHEAWFLVSQNMPSPMGGFLNAFSTKEAAQTFQEKVGGEIFNWESIKASYRK